MSKKKMTSVGQGMEALKDVSLSAPLPAEAETEISILTTDQLMSPEMLKQHEAEIEAAQVQKDQKRAEIGIQLERIAKVQHEIHDFQVRIREMEKISRGVLTPTLGLLKQELRKRESYLANKLMATETAAGRIAQQKELLGEIKAGRIKYGQAVRELMTKGWALEATPPQLEAIKSRVFPSPYLTYWDKERGEHGEVIYLVAFNYGPTVIRGIFYELRKLREKEEDHRKELREEARQYPSVSLKETTEGRVLFDSQYFDVRSEKTFAVQLGLEVTPAELKNQKTGVTEPGRRITVVKVFRGPRFFEGKYVSVNEAGHVSGFQPFQRMVFLALRK